MEIKIDSKKIFQGTPIKIISGAILSLIILLLVFRLGMMVGYRKAGFSYGWSENYERNFGGRMGGFGRPGGPGDFLRAFDDRQFMGADGIVGRIIKINDHSIVVRGQANEETIVLLNDKTVIRRFRDNIKPADLKVDDTIVVIGEPNKVGQIEARLIRLMPAGSPGSLLPSGMPGLSQPLLPSQSTTAATTTQLK